MSSGLKILFASAEVVPFAKTGGLADVAGALPQVLAQMGHDVRIVMPCYGSIDAEKYGLRQVAGPFEIPHAHDQITVAIEESDAIPGVPTYLIRNDYLYNRNSLYGQADDDHRFVAYCRAMLEMMPELDWFPDIIHCNDWHTALTPVYLKTIYASQAAYRNIATLFTVHNLAYQGSFSPHIMDLAGLPWEMFSWDKLAFWGQFNFMKNGLMYADVISTVSEKYAEETRTEEYGEGLQDVLEFRKDDYFGIINGIDYCVWNPCADDLIAAKFSADNLKGKATCKRALQKAMGLPQKADVPIFGLISRLSSQKGLDLLEEALPDLLDSEKMQVVILGAGDEYFQDMLQRLSDKHPDKLKLAMRFDNALAHQIYAGSDAFLMPSRYEPCGLGQMISLAYGTLPVVRATGGLADTIKEFKGTPRSTGNGFVFEPYDAVALTNAIQRALKCYDKPECWQAAVQNAFKSDFSWECSAKKYVKVYKEAIKKVKNGEKEALSV